MQASAQLKELLHSINRKKLSCIQVSAGGHTSLTVIFYPLTTYREILCLSSHISVKLSHRDTKFPEEYYKDSLTRITLGDFLNRQFEQQGKSLYLPCKRIRKKRPDLSQSLWSGGSCTYRLRDYGKRHHCPFFHWFPGQWQNHQLPRTGKILFDFLPGLRA